MYYSLTDKIPITEMFHYEAQDFTPWLAVHLDRLDRALGMKLKLVATEYRLGGGSKRVDIMAEDYDLDIPVVIENQFEKSDDKHLGQLLSYAALTEAGVAIWISEEFSWDHIRTIRWINENSLDSFQLYGVEVLARQGSHPNRKVRFKVINPTFQWSSETKFLSCDQDYLDNGMYYKFWQSLIRERPVRNFTLKNQSLERRYHRFRSGFRNAKYVARFTPTSETISVSLEVAYLERVRIFYPLKSYQEDIEHKFGRDLKWEDSPYRNFHRIGIEEAGSIIDSTDETKSWMIDNLMRLKRTFTPYLTSVIHDRRI